MAYCEIYCLTLRSWNKPIVWRYHGNNKHADGCVMTIWYSTRVHDIDEFITFLLKY